MANLIKYKSAHKGSAKASSQFDAVGSLVPRKDWNVSSYLDNGVGDYSINLSVSMSDSNYFVSVGRKSTGGGGYLGGIAQTTSQYSFRYFDGSNFADTNSLTTIVHGDAA